MTVKTISQLKQEIYAIHSNFFLPHKDAGIFRDKVLEKIEQLEQHLRELDQYYADLYIEYGNEDICTVIRGLLEAKP